jgi:hypothetical protein
MTTVGDDVKVNEHEVRQEDKLAAVAHFIMMHYAEKETANP